MPIHCPIAFARLTEAEMRNLDYEVMRHAFATHKALGCLCDESVYQAHFTHLLVASGIQAEREVPVTLTFRNFLEPLYLDLGRSARHLRTQDGRGSDGRSRHAASQLPPEFCTQSGTSPMLGWRPYRWGVSQFMVTFCVLQFVQNIFCILSSTLSAR